MNSKTLFQSSTKLETNAGIHKSFSTYFKHAKMEYEMLPEVDIWVNLRSYLIIGTDNLFYSCPNKVIKRIQMLLHQPSHLQLQTMKR